MKILFTSVGRRVELVQAFKESARRLSVDLEIIGADISSTAPALYFCDRQLIVPRISNSDYIPTLVDYCYANHIDALVPTIDTDLLLLSKSVDQFADTKVIISAQHQIEICRDKRLTSSFFEEAKVHYPAVVDDYHNYVTGYPAFIKPKDGSSSINAFKVNNQQELELFSQFVPDYIIQPFIAGDEYTVDAFCDFHGNPIYITPRKRLAVRSGEVLKTEIVRDNQIVEEMKRIIGHFHPCGPITVQLIRQLDTGKDFYIEINPRFGGGAPLSMKAGANSSEALIRLLRGESVQYCPEAAKNGSIYCRFDQSVEVGR